MPGATISIDKQLARRVWLQLQGLLSAPHSTRSEHGVLDTVRQLGMVQLDTISTVARAHHHILWSRHNTYCEDDYNALLGNEASVFEHFSHDAVILPLDIYPYWQRQHQRRSDSYKRGALGRQLAGVKVQKEILALITENGPMCSRDFAVTHKQKADKSKHAWMRPPHKLALDYLWLKGDLCVSHRRGFTKYYDLSERLISKALGYDKYTHQQQIDFLCSSALQRLGFATATEIQRFYEACDLSEVKLWLQQNTHKHCTVSVQGHDDRLLLRYAPKNIEATLESLPKPCRRMRIISPFDPVVRDRTRLKQLFGMYYRIEIYTPAAQRKYGYYVYPVLEADRIVARIDVSANKNTDTLEVRKWWLEPGEKYTNSRAQRLRSELKRLAKLARVRHISNLPDPSKHP